MRKSRLNCRHLFLIVIFTLLSINNLWSQTYSETKKISKIFKINHLTTIEIVNKYGSINFKNWTKDSLKLEIVLSVNTTQTIRLKEILANVDFNISGDENYRIAKTIFGTKSSSLFSDIKSITDAISSSSDVKIDYFITAPNYINVKANNKYGDIVVETLKGSFNAVLSNGGLKAENLSGQSTIDVKSGTINLAKVNSAKIISWYSDINITEADQITLATKSAKIQIEQANILKLQSARDKIEIQRVNSFFGETFFSAIHVAQLANEMSFKMNFGSFFIDNIAKSFSFINLTTKNTDIKINFKKDVAFQFELLLTNINPKFSDDAILFQKLPSDISKEQIIVKGKFGKSDKYSRINIAAESSPLLIQTK